MGHLKYFFRSISDHCGNTLCCSKAVGSWATWRTSFCHMYNRSPHQIWTLMLWVPWPLSCWPRPRSPSTARPRQVRLEDTYWLIGGLSDWLVDWLSCVRESVAGWLIVPSCLLLFILCLSVCLTLFSCLLVTFQSLICFWSVKRKKEKKKKGLWNCLTHSEF